MPQPEDRTVCIVDDDADIRGALTPLLRSVGLRTVGFADAEAFLHSLDRVGPNACLLVDLRLPGMGGLELMEALAARGARLPTIMMTGHADVGVAVRAMKAGALDFIEKPFGGQEIVEAVQHALRQGARTLNAEAHRRELDSRAAALTPREREIMGLVARGERNKCIASNLGLSVRTVEQHRARIMQKMQARTLSDLVRMRLALAPAEVVAAAPCQAASRPNRPLW